MRSIITRKIHKYSTGTDGHRAIGRTFPSSPLQSFSQAEAIFSRTNTPPFNPRMSNVARVQTLIGKSPLLNGLLFFIVLTRVNRSEKLRMSMVSRMKQYVA
jgi:hypothetical protein